MAAETTITDLPDSPIPLETGSYLPMDVGTVTSKVSLANLFNNPPQIGADVPSAGTFTFLTADNQLALPALSDGLLKSSSGIVTNATEGVDYAPPQTVTIVNSAGTTTVLTNESTYIQVITGSSTQIMQLPDETTLVPGPAFQIMNNTTETAVIQDSASTLIYTLPSGGGVQMFTYSASTPTGNWGVNVLPPGNMQVGQVRWGDSALDMIGNSIENAAIGLTTANAGRFTNALSTVITASQGALATTGPNTATLTSDGLYMDVSSTTGVARFSTLGGLTAFNFYTGGIGNTLISSLPNMAIGGVNTNEVWTVSSTPYTLTSQTAAQKIFNTSTNGGVTLPVGTYFFFCEFGVTNLSGTSGTFGFALGGTATIGSQAWGSTTSKGGGLTTATQAQLTFSVAPNTAISAGNTSQNGVAIIRGIFRLTAAGTVIPQISMQQASAAIIAAGSWFRASPISPSATATTVGNWS